MTDQQYDKRVKLCIYGLYVAMAVVAMLLPAALTVHPSILNKMLGMAGLAAPQMFYSYQLLYAEIILVYVTCLFLNFKEHQVFTEENIRYIRVIGKLIIFRQFIYIPFEMMVSGQFSLQFNVRDWTVGAVCFLIARMFEQRLIPVEGKPVSKLPVWIVTIGSFVIAAAGIGVRYGYSGTFQEYDGGTEMADYSDLFGMGFYENEEREEQVVAQGELYLSFYELEELEENYTKEEAQEIKTLSIDVPLGETKKERETIKDLSKLSYFSNVESLCITSDGGEDGYQQFDQGVLSLFPKLSEVEFSGVMLQDLPAFPIDKVKKLSLSWVDGSKLSKEGYGVFRGIEDLTIKGTVRGVNEYQLFDAMDHLAVLTLDCDNIEIYMEQAARHNTLRSLSIEEFPYDDGTLNRWLSQCTNLKELEISFKDAYESSTYELPGIAKLTSLEKLSLSASCQDEQAKVISYYDELNALTKLKTLTLKGVRIDNLSFITSMKELRRMDVSYNFIEDLSPIKALTNLEFIDCSFNRIQDLTPLAGLSNVKTLMAASNRIRSIEPLRELTSLESLNVSNGAYTLWRTDEQEIRTAYRNNESIEVEDDYPDSHPYNPRCLDEVGVSKEYREDSGYYRNPKFALKLYGEDYHWGKARNEIVDLDPVANMKNLKFLDVSGNQVEDLSPIRELHHLTYLSCMKNRIADISMITKERFPSLSYLYLSQNRISEGSTIEQWKDDETVVAYCLTPYYLESEYNLKEGKSPMFHIEFYGMDVTELGMNIGTRGEK